MADGGDGPIARQRDGPSTVPTLPVRGERVVSRAPAVPSSRPSFRGCTCCRFPCRRKGLGSETRPQFFSTALLPLALWGLKCLPIARGSSLGSQHWCPRSHRAKGSAESHSHRIGFPPFFLGPSWSDSRTDAEKEPRGFAWASRAAQGTFWLVAAGMCCTSHAFLLPAVSGAGVNNAGVYPEQIQRLQLTPPSHAFIAISCIYNNVLHF